MGHRPVLSSASDDPYLCPPPEAPSSLSDRLTTSVRPLLPVLGLVALVCLPCLFNGYALDDELAQHDGQNAAIVGTVHSPAYFWTLRYWEGVDNQSLLYRPLTVASFAYVNLCSPGFEAFAQHLCNLLLHLLAVSLSYLLLLDLRVAAGPARLAALTFGLCGIHGEVIAGIVGRSELLSCTLGLAACLLLPRGQRSLAGVCLFLAFSAKESALAWAPFLPCWLWVRALCRGGDAPGFWELLWREARPLALVCGLPMLAWFGLRYPVIMDLQGGAAAGLFSYAQNPLAHVDPLVRVMSGVTFLGMGLAKTLLPLGLSSIYGPGLLDPVTSPAQPGFLLACLVLAVWLFCGLRYARRWPLLFLSVALFFGFSFLTSNIPITIGTIFGERLYYVPSLFLVCLVALGAGASPARLHKPLLLAFGVWMLAHSAALVERCLAFRDKETMLRTDAGRHPESADLQIKYATHIRHRPEDRDEVIALLQKGLAIDPEFPDAWTFLGDFARDAGRWDEAEDHYRKALSCEYLAFSGVERYLLDQLCTVLALKADFGGLLELTRDAVARHPDHYQSNICLLLAGLERGLPAAGQADEWGRALQRLGMAGARSPDPGLALLRAMFLIRHGAPDKAGRRALLGQMNPPLEQILKAPGMDALARYGALYQARLAAELGELDAARTRYRMLLDDPLPTRGLKGPARKELEALR